MNYQTEIVVRIITITAIIYIGTRIGSQPNNFKRKILPLLSISTILFIFQSIAFRKIMPIFFLINITFILIIAAMHHLIKFHGDVKIYFFTKNRDD